MERNIALILEYDGSLFHGWQSQNNAVTVSDVVASAIEKLLDRRVRLTGASRTDAGVHARGQVANFYTDRNIPPEKYAFALNTLLPDGVTCVGSYEVDTSFHSRFSAAGKTYSYTILNRRFPSALLRNRAWHVPAPLDKETMLRAASVIIGEHDFLAFMSTGSPVKSTVRRVTDISLSCSDLDLIRVLVSGNGFLYNMVRIIIGTLVYVGQGRLSISDVERALISGDRRIAGKTAPPWGLCLESVNYCKIFKYAN